jgi:hypothetical protein
MSTGMACLSGFIFSNSLPDSCLLRPYLPKGTENYDFVHIYIPIRPKFGIEAPKMGYATAETK